MKEAIIIACAFGLPAELPANIWLAMVAQTKAKKLRSQGYKVIVYTQRDLDFYISDPGVEVRYIDQGEDEEIPTLRIVEWAAQSSPTATEVWVAAAPPHLWRVVRDTTKTFGLRPNVCNDIFIYRYGWWFSKDSTQPRVRSWLSWWSREIIIMLMPWWVYKLIAK